MTKLFVVENIEDKTARVFTSAERAATFLLGRRAKDFKILVCQLDKVISNIPSEVSEIRDLLNQS